MINRILVLTGASGAGKTTLALKLNELAIPGVKGINCDRVKVESSGSRRFTRAGQKTRFST